MHRKPRHWRRIGSDHFWTALLVLAVASAGLRFGMSDAGRAFLARTGLFDGVVPGLATRLDLQLTDRLAHLGLLRGDIEVRDFTVRGRRIRQYAFPCPQHLTPTLVHLEMQRAARAVHADILDAEERHVRGDELWLLLGFGSAPTHRLIVRAPSQLPRDIAGVPQKPRVALLIDDLGYNTNATTRGFMSLGVPITVAVLPELSDSDRLFELAHEQGIPALLHLPMQPEGGENPGKHAVRVGMSPEEIEAIVDRHQKRYKTFFGVNNHMGSRATADPATMQALLRALRRRDLVFIDSQTSSHSVGKAVARETGVWCVANDIFLDDREETAEQVAKNLERLASLARKRGLAIGIAHPHPATLAAVREMLPRLQAHGIEFVTIESLRPAANVAVRNTGN